MTALSDFLSTTTKINGSNSSNEHQLECLLSVLSQPQADDDDDRYVVLQERLPLDEEILVSELVGQCRPKMKAMILPDSRRLGRSPSRALSASRTLNKKMLPLPRVVSAAPKKIPFRLKSIRSVPKSSRIDVRSPTITELLSTCVVLEDSQAWWILCASDLFSGRRSEDVCMEVTTLPAFTWVWIKTTFSMTPPSKCHPTELGDLETLQEGSRLHLKYDMGTTTNVFLHVEEDRLGQAGDALMLLKNEEETSSDLQQLEQEPAFSLPRASLFTSGIKRTRPSW